MRADFANALAGTLSIQRRDLIEKDVILHQMLLDLSSDKFFSENFAFKGKTCLIKCYYGYKRFSEDIDFTEKGSSEESWMFLDEYERREDYDKWMKAAREDPELVKLMEAWFPKWAALIVLGSKKGEVWTEVEKLRVEPRKKA